MKTVLTTWMFLPKFMTFILDENAMLVSFHYAY